MAFANLDEAVAAGARELVLDSDRPGWAWTAWPDALWTLASLESLTIIQRALFEIPAAIRSLTNLRSLEVRGSTNRIAPGGLGELASLRSLTWIGAPTFPADLSKLRLDHLKIVGSWGRALPVLATIPVRINVTLLGDEPAADDLATLDLSAWRALQELELDAYPDFDPRVFDRSLPRCGFAINRTGNRARDRV